MTPIALYPSQASLKKTAAVGAFNLFIGYQFLTWTPDGSALIPLAFFIGGFALIAQTVWAHLNPRPSFEADAEGFSILGKKKQGWDAYRGVHIHTVRLWFFPIMRTIVIKTGKSVLGRRVHIKMMQMSAPANEMARDIDSYAQHALRKLELVEAFATVASKPKAAAKPAAAAHPQPQPQPQQERTRSFEERAGLSRASSSSGPVTSVPRLSERVFGRGKVI